MHLLPKKRYESNRISCLSMPSKQKQPKKIKTQPVDASKFVTRIGFNTQGEIGSQTRYTDKNKSSPQILVRKFNDKQKHIHSPSNLQYSYKNFTQRTQRQTQRQKFMKELKVRVLRSQNSSARDEEIIHQQRAKQLTARYQAENQMSKLNKSRAKSSISFDDLTPRELIKSRKESCQGSIVNIKSVNGDCEDDKLQLRDRAKTFAKDFSKIVEQNLNFKQKTCNENQSKTIEANDIENKINRSQSIVIIDNPLKTNLPPYQVSQNMIKSQFMGRKAANVSAQDTSKQDSLYPNNTEKYEQEVQQITKEFLSDWQKMNTNKSQLYEKFRNKLVRQFPEMRKKYKQSELTPQAYETSKKMSSNLLTPALQSSIKVSFNNQTNLESQVNYLTVTQLKYQSQKLQKNYDAMWKNEQRRTLRQIFKQAHFYSKTKNKCFSVKYQKSEEEVQQQRKVRNIQKNMTFMSYINKKEGKLNVRSNRQIRGDNIIKNKESILQLQKEGSPQQQYLLKCLDNAIEDCMKA